jgi:hypothetical protein
MAPWNPEIRMKGVFARGAGNRGQEGSNATRGPDSGRKAGSKVSGMGNDAVGSGGGLCRRYGADSPGTIAGRSQRGRPGTATAEHPLLLRRRLGAVCLDLCTGGGGASRFVPRNPDAQHRRGRASGSGIPSCVRAGAVVHALPELLADWSLFLPDRSRCHSARGAVGGRVAGGSPASARGGLHDRQDRQGLESRDAR